MKGYILNTHIFCKKFFIRNWILRSIKIDLKGPVINNAGKGAGRGLEGPSKTLGYERGVTKNLWSEKGGHEATKLI